MKIITEGQHARGFTLIELMIVVAILGILAVIAIPLYQDYVAKAKVGAAVAEAAGGKTGIESEIVLMPTMDAAATMRATRFATPDTSNCTLSVSAAQDGASAITCTIKGGPASVASKQVTWSRAPEGHWTCQAVGIKPEHTTPACPEKKA